MQLSDDDVREILRIIDETPLSELHVQTDGFELHVVKRESGLGSTETVDGVSSEDGLVTIEAPMLGTFYRAEAPGAEPFVEVGSRVEPDTIVCIIEVMKMMNSVPARVSGEIVEICAENAELVEFGAPLFRVRS